MEVQLYLARPWPFGFAAKREKAFKTVLLRRLPLRTYTLDIGYKIKFILNTTKELKFVVKNLNDNVDFASKKSYIRH